MRASATIRSSATDRRGRPAAGLRSPVVPLPDRPITYPPAEEPVPEPEQPEPGGPERPERPEVVPARPEPAHPVPVAPPAGGAAG